jgi:hypothetical protein
MSTPEPPEPPEPPGPPGPPEPISTPEPLGPMTTPRGQAAIWWQREWGIAALGIFALLLGGVVGFAVGNSNAKTTTRTVTNNATTNTVASASNSTTVASATNTITAPGKTTTARGKTVTTPGKTVTVAGAAKTVTVAGAAKTVTVAVTRTKTVAASTSASTTPGVGSTGSGVQNFTGADTQNLGTIHVPSQSLLRWSCAGCANATFVLSNNSRDAATIQVNSRNAVSGQTVIDAGTYTDVTGQGSGPWSFTITPGG